MKKKTRSRSSLKKKPEAIAAKKITGSPTLGGGTFLQNSGACEAFFYMYHKFTCIDHHLTRQ